MSDGFSNRPRVQRGALVEYGLSLPPVAVLFQFNPVQVTRNRSISYQLANARPGQSARDLHQRAEYADLLKLQSDQLVTVNEETIGFELRLDATDALDRGEIIGRNFGIAPQLATLERMVLPKSESLAAQILGDRPGFSFTRSSNPPMVLFVFGRRRVLPVNVTTLNITETDFSAALDPVRATVTVGLSVIEGSNGLSRYTAAGDDLLSAIDVSAAAARRHVPIPR